MKSVKQQLKKCLWERFSISELKAPLFFDSVNGLRFDLQEVNPEDDNYFDIVFHRATSLIESVIDPTDEIFLVYGIHKWKRRKIRLGNYVFKQIDCFTNNEVDYYSTTGLYEKGDAHNIAVLKLNFNRINYKNILTAIANTDFPPRQPRFSFLSDTNIFFVNISKNVIFHMYDDRGIDIISSDLETLNRYMKSLITGY